MNNKIIYDKEFTTEPYEDGNRSIFDDVDE